MKLSESKFKRLKSIIESMTNEEKMELHSALRSTIENSIPKEIRDLPRINWHPYKIVRNSFGYKIFIYYRSIGSMNNFNYRTIQPIVLDLLKKKNISYDIKPSDVKFTEIAFDKESGSILNDKTFWVCYEIDICLNINEDLSEVSIDDIMSHIKINGSYTLSFDTRAELESMMDKFKNLGMMVGTRKKGNQYILTITDPNYSVKTEIPSNVLDKLPDILKDFKVMEILDNNVYYDVLEENDLFTVDIYYYRSLFGHFTTNPHLDNIIITNVVSSLFGKVKYKIVISKDVKLQNTTYRNVVLEIER